MKTMEEVVRFYNHFGLTLSEDPRELPDHLATELEFLHFLAFREAQALQSDGDPGAFQRAARDFVARHPGRWVPKLLPKLKRAKPPRYYEELFAILARFLEYDARQLVEIAGPAPSDA
jgi:DMSO reductase family type II enzyme chaperone